MSFIQIVSVTMIHLIVPLLGIICFILLCKKMRSSHVTPPLYFIYLCIFGICGIILVDVLTFLFWEPSGITVLTFIFDMTVAPILTLISTGYLWNKRSTSLFHRIAFFICLIYTILAGIWWTINIIYS